MDSTLHYFFCLEVLVKAPNYIRKVVYYVSLYLVVNLQLLYDTIHCKKKTMKAKPDHDTMEGKVPIP